jgi:hypothetical protein
MYTEICIYCTIPENGFSAQRRENKYCVGYIESVESDELKSSKYPPLTHNWTNCLPK